MRYCTRKYVWDTGVGIPAKELKSIFEEFCQLDNLARGRAKGLGLGPSSSTSGRLHEIRKARLIIYDLAHALKQI